MRGSLLLAVAFGGAFVAAPARGGDQPIDLPFPVGKTQILRNEKASYWVEGRIKIPQGIEVTVLRGIQIRGKGQGAVIEVEGELKVHGVQRREVIFENVTIEPAPVFDAIHMDQTICRGGGGIVVPKDKRARGYVLLELFDFVAPSVLELRMDGGSIELSSVCADLPVVLDAKDPADGTPNKVKFEVRGCIQEPRFECQPHGGRVGLVGGLLASGANEMVIRLSRLGGALTSVSDWRQILIFDGNKVGSRRLEFVQPVGGRFATGQFVKCDVYSEKVKFSAPFAKQGEFEDTRVDRWWFRGIDDPKQVLEKVVEDNGDDAENSVRIKFPKINGRALELAGPLER